MLVRINDRIEAVLAAGLALAFAAMIATVFAQVAARNVLEIPLIWTLDVAQLLFSWCIFIGAAVAFRRGGHYVVDLLPAGALRGRRVQAVLSLIASVVVIAILVRYGATLAEIATRRVSPSIGISEFWFFLPIPLGGAFMALFLIEKLMTGESPE
ncbi:TRAP transporter small permease [Pelagibius sp. Alg239-R121]|uniref:TRAP transporter small permease n=1 Tax=Pelagibius sp. Alg239-R121 TaxID=2993448 RepID=UPI0024A64D30|nr:TRAP transporter small permease [Pelagibius sp. Alg239-R121]